MHTTKNPNVRATVVPVLTAEHARNLAALKLGHATLHEVNDPSKLVYDFGPLTKQPGDYRIFRKF